MILLPSLLLANPQPTLFSNQTNIFLLILIHSFSFKCKIKKIIFYYVSKKKKKEQIKQSLRKSHQSEIPLISEKLKKSYYIIVSFSDNFGDIIYVKLGIGGGDLFTIEWTLKTSTR